MKQQSQKHSQVIFAMVGSIVGSIVWPIVGVAQTAPGSSVCPAQLTARIEKIINQPQFDRARWGILVQHLERNPKTLYDREAERFFLPASTAKLFTTAAALEKLGGDYRIRTSIVGEPVSDGVWNLRLIGKGDPSFSDIQLKSLAKQLKAKGVKTIQQLVLDDRGFAGEAINPTWEWGDLQESYAPVVNSLIINQNAIQVTFLPQKLGQPLTIQWQNPGDITGWKVENLTKTVAATETESVNFTRDLNQRTIRISGQLRVGATAETIDIAAPNPLQLLNERLQMALKAENINLQAIQVWSNWMPAPLTNPKEREIAFVESPPLRDLIREVNQESNNLYTEALLKQLAHAEKSKPAKPIVSATESGLQILQTHLTQRQVDPKGYQLADGSGLSRMNLVSPTALVQVLQSMNYSPLAQDYRQSLPVAGQSGSLTNRFSNTPAQAIVQAKTGGMTNVSSLAGYITPPEYQPLAFSILLNQSTATGREQRQAIDEIVVLLAQLQPCSK
jgi:serine-type D-Ala-D-Ala carboxypeptidase/endopeptidase (penicillin-binding protein 4)